MFISENLQFWKNHKRIGNDLIEHKRKNAANWTSLGIVLFSFLVAYLAKIFERKTPVKEKIVFAIVMAFLFLLLRNYFIDNIYIVK